MPSVGRGLVALNGGQEAFSVAATNSIQPSTSGHQTEMGTSLAHAGKMQPSVEARIVSEDQKVMQ